MAEIACAQRGAFCFMDGSFEAVQRSDDAGLDERLGARRTHAEAGEVGVDRVDRRPQSELEQRWAIQIGREGLPDATDRFAQTSFVATRR